MQLQQLLHRGKESLKKLFFFLNPFHVIQIRDPPRLAQWLVLAEIPVSISLMCRPTREIDRNNRNTNFQTASDVKRHQGNWFG